MRDGLLPGMEARPWKSNPGKFTYRYKPPGQPWRTLGSDLRAACAEVLRLQAGVVDETGTLRWLWGEFKAKHKRWAKLAPGTRADYELAWKQIDPVLGHCQPGKLTSKDVARYVHVDRADSPRRADIEKTVLSNIFKYGVLIGVCDRNPAADVEPHNAEPKRVTPQTAAVRAFLGWLEQQGSQRRVLAYMAEFAELTGNRRCEFLQAIKPQADRKAGKVRLFRAKQRGEKRGKVVEVVEITPRLAALLDKIEALGRDGLYLFPNRNGDPYDEDSFGSLWQRCVNDAIKEKIITKEQRFNFHALRRYFTTQYVQQEGELPRLHANPAVTASVYDGTTEVQRKAL